MIRCHEKNHTKLTNHSIRSISPDEIVCYALETGSPGGDEDNIFILTIQGLELVIYSGNTIHGGLDESSVSRLIPESGHFFKSWSLSDHPKGWEGFIYADSLFVFTRSFMAGDLKIYLECIHSNDHVERLAKGVLWTCRAYESRLLGHFSRAELSCRSNLNVYFVVDCSQSMSGAMIGMLNAFLPCLIGAIESAAEEHRHVHLQFRLMAYGREAEWVSGARMPEDEFVWKKLHASEGAAMGDAFCLLREEFRRMDTLVKEQLPPVIVLISCSRPSDDAYVSISRFKSTKWSEKAVKLAILLNNESNRALMNFFTGRKQMVLDPDQFFSIVPHIKWDAVRIPEEGPDGRK